MTVVVVAARENRPRRLACLRSLHLGSLRPVHRRPEVRAVASSIQLSPPLHHRCRLRPAPVLDAEESAHRLTQAVVRWSVLRGQQSGVRVAPESFYRRPSSSPRVRWPGGYP